MFSTPQLQNTEERLHSRLMSTEERFRVAEADHSVDLESALVKLEEESQKSVSSLAAIVLLYSFIYIFFIPSAFYYVFKFAL